MEQQQITDLLRQIIGEEYPDCSDVFEFEGDQLVKDALAGRPLRDMEPPKAVSAFGVPVKEVLEFIGVILGTVTAILQLRHMRRENKNHTDHIDAVKERWEKELIGEGVPDTKASEIVEKFAAELIG